jgi:acyl carrier protein
MKTGEQLQDVEQWLTEWFVARSNAGREIARMPPAAVRETDYFDGGWLSSMDVVELVTGMEEKFAMQFSDGDFQDPRFVTIGGLAELILQRSAPASESR